MQQYEPQVVGNEQAFDNFMPVHFQALKVDHLIMAPPQVVADSRRKPQQYESLAQPFKKDRRFIHTQGESGWETSEVNP